MNETRAQQIATILWVFNPLAVEPSFDPGWWYSFARQIELCESKIDRYMYMEREELDTPQVLEQVERLYAIDGNPLKRVG